MSTVILSIEGEQMRHIVLLSAILTACALHTLTAYSEDISLTQPLLEPGKVLVQPTDLPKPMGLNLTLQDYPRTSGSTSAEPLGVWIACRLLGLESGWSWPKGSRKGFLNSIYPLLTSRSIRSAYGYFTTKKENRLHPLRSRLTDPYRDNLEDDYAFDKDFFIRGISHRRLQNMGISGLDTSLPKNDKILNLSERRRASYNPDLKGRTLHKGTHGSYVALIDGKVDLIYECRKPSADEIKLMKEKGVELELTPVALDAFIFLKNWRNQVDNLSLKQAHDMFKPGADGKPIIKNWKEVGGVNKQIMQYIRNRNSGSQETMESLVMGGMPTIGNRRGVRGGDISLAGMGGPFVRLGAASDFDGIGFTFLYYERYMAWGAGGVKVFSIDSVNPSRETIANRTYPLVTEVYAVTRKDLPPLHPASRLKAWLLTEEGQKIINETGYVPITWAKKAK